MPSDMMKAPENLRVTGKDGAILSEWNAVEDAVGYKLQFFDAEEPEKCIKTRYAQDCRKTILGFKNKKEYLVRVCAFKYVDGIEQRGNFSGKLPCVPMCDKLKAQGALTLKKGETAQLVCEYLDEEPVVKYQSENRRIAEVSPSGLVTAKSSGTSYIKITASDGQTFRTKVAVERDLSSGSGKAVLMLTGDLMCAVAHQRAAEKYSYDFNDAFAKIKPTLDRADYVIGVLETACDDSKPYEYEQLRLPSGAPNCNSPSTFISAIANAGFNGLVTANNHNCDTGKAGLEATVDEIKRHGMENFGTLGNNPVLITVNNIKIAIIACCMISNGLEDEMGLDMLSVVNYIGRFEQDYFVELVNRARAMGAEYIIAYQHWGKMNSPKTVRSQTDTARFMANSGADMIVGSHPHVVQKFIYIKTDDGRRVPCAYSLGNFLTSMREMRENRDSAILRVELTRKAAAEKTEIASALSYIPCFNEEIEQGIAVTSAYPPHSAESTASYLRTKEIIGKRINPFVYRPTVLFSGSSILSDIFKSGRGFRTDSKLMYLSQISLGSEKSFEPPEGSDDILSIEIGKDFAGYIRETSPDYLAVDFYTAASVSCHRINSVKTEEPCYFTNIKRFRKSEFYDKHAFEIVRVRPPFGEEIWKPLIRRYAEIVKSVMPHDRIILFRTSVNSKRFTGTELRLCSSPDRRNKMLREMEDLFISIADPVVIDLSRHYFTDVNDGGRFEPEYYIDAYKAAEKAAEGKGRSCISVPDDSIWFDRVVKFYNNMTARAYQSWLLDDKNAADKIIRHTNKDFVQRHRERLLIIKRAGRSDLSALHDLFINDAGAGELIRAGEIIAALERGNLSKTYDFFELAFKEHFNIIKSMVRLLAAETGVAVNESSAEIVFLLRGKPQFSRYAANLNKRTIDIWGSCVSRESINRCKDAFVGKYVFKQSPILAYDPPIDVEFPEGADQFCGSYWRRRTMRDSFYRAGFDTLDESAADWLMVDFYDLVCKMAEYKGGLFEIDDFIRRTDFFKNIKNECRECYLFEKREMKYCFDTITRFANQISEFYDDKIILVKTDLKDSYITLDDRLEQMPDDGMYEIKRKFISLCEERFASVTKCYVIDVSKHFYSSDKFPLGGAHIVHYEDEFYRQTAEYISEILKGSERRVFSTVDENYLLLRDLKLRRDE